MRPWRWAAWMAAATVSMTEARSRGVRSFRASDRVLPLMSCMAMKTWPLSSPTSKTLQTLGWSTFAWLQASWKNRRMCRGSSRARNFRATSRLRTRSKAR